jgi:hypothetical protein
VIEALRAAGAEVAPGARGRGVPAALARLLR